MPPGKNCFRLMELRSQLKFVLTQEGHETLSAVIADIRAFARTNSAPLDQLHELINKLLPLLLRTGLSWNEIVALATPDGYEIYASGLPSSKNLQGALVEFIDATVRRNQELVNGMNSCEFAALFFENLKDQLSRPAEANP